ncbi:hypothetical protein ILYODFUR_014537 [Ilyodon furcidens]|uniref:Uncharacterized protein n=1 Tax=Ilyodon furcidens TaxID=33524 RepID=A0ABV0T867_9TELE
MQELMSGLKIFSLTLPSTLKEVNRISCTFRIYRIINSLFYLCGFLKLQGSCGSSEWRQDLRIALGVCIFLDFPCTASRETNIYFVLFFTASGWTCGPLCLVCVFGALFLNSSFVMGDINLAFRLRVILKLWSACSWLQQDLEAPSGLAADKDIDITQGSWFSRQ